jgi:hypothetical protein
LAVVQLYMCYVYAGLCALRYFSFLWAHVPLIILDGKSSGEAEEEADDNVGGSSEEHLDEDEREEVLFVEDLDLEGEGAEPLEEDVQETTAGGAILHRRGLGLVTSVMIVLRNKTFLYETVFAAMGALAGKCSVCVCVCSAFYFFQHFSVGQADPFWHAPLARYLNSCLVSPTI